MNCAELQKLLPEIMESGGNAEEEAHLQSCAVCSDLVQDLRYIAESARLLLPIQDPSPRVWAGIREALEREGLVRPPVGTARFRPQTAARPRRWLTGASLLAAAALLLFAIGVLWFTNHATRETQPVATASVPQAVSPAAVDDDDARLLSAVEQRSPALLATYRENLDTVNAYIRDARHTVEQNPYDMGARDHLLRACNQKTLLYEMALIRSEE
jgi:hypothetical protein